MALPSTTVWEIRTTGANDNGGGFNDARGGTDYSQQAAAQLSLTDCTTSGAGSTTLTSATGGFTSVMVGNLIYIASGTNFDVGFYEIVTYTDTNNVVLDRTPSASGAGSGGNAKVGGAQLDLQTVFDAMAAGHKLWIAGGTYNITSQLQFNNVGGQTTPIRIIGYDTTRGDATGPTVTIDAGGGAFHAFRVGPNNTYTYLFIENIKVGNTSSASSYIGIYVYGWNIQLTRCATYSTGGDGFRSAEINTRLIGCEATTWGTNNSTRYAFNISSASRTFIDGCIAHDPHSVVYGRGYYLANQTMAFNCIAAGCRWGFLAGINSQVGSVVLKNCIAYGSNTVGFYASSSAGELILLNCIGVSNGTYGLQKTVAGSRVFVEKFFHYGNATAGQDSTAGYLYLNDDQAANILELDEDPFIDAANLDFRLKKSTRLVGGGRFLGAGWPDGYLDENGLMSWNANNSPGATGAGLHRRRT